jgi:transporter family-2 protein
MIGLLWALIGVVAGMIIALQAPINAQLAHKLGSPVVAAAASFVAGTVLLIAVALVTAQGHAIDWRAPPWWMYVAGGFLGAGFVTITLLLTPRMGAAATMGLIVAGQLLAGLVLDRLGYFDLAVREMTAGRVGGAVLVVFGALMLSYL